MRPERKIIRHLTINELSGVTVPAMEGALVKIIKAGDDRHDPSKPDALTAPVAFHKPTEHGERQIAKMLAAIRGDHAPITKHATHKDHPTMSHFETLMKSRTDKFGETREEAFRKLKADPDESGLSAAYARDEAEAARRYAENDRSN